MHAANLNAAVGGTHAELQLQLEIPGFAATPMRNVFSFTAFSGVFADDGAIDRLPEGRVAFHPSATCRRRSAETCLIIDDQRLSAHRAAAAAPAAARVPAAPARKAMQTESTRTATAIPFLSSPAPDDRSSRSRGDTSVISHASSLKTSILRRAGSTRAVGVPFELPNVFALVNAPVR